MGIDWRKYDKHTIREGVDSEGNRLLSLFLKEYQEVYQVSEVSPSCGQCFDRYYKRLTEHITMKENINTDLAKAKGFALLKKYEGIPLHFGSRKRVYNNNMTTEDAEFLLENHPRGVGLFESIPEGYEVKDEAKVIPLDETPEGKEEDSAPEDEVKDEAKGLSRKTRAELNAIAIELGFDPDDFANKAELIQAINEVEE